MIPSWLASLLTGGRARKTLEEFDPNQPALRPIPEMETALSSPVQAVTTEVPVLPPLEESGVDEIGDDLLTMFRDEAPIETASFLLANSVDHVDTDELVLDLRSLLHSL